MAQVFQYVSEVYKVQPKVGLKFHKMVSQGLSSPLKIYIFHYQVLLQ